MTDNQSITPRLPTDSREELLAELLLEWEEANDAGKSRSAAQLCINHPELEAELAKRIQALQAVDSVLQLDLTLGASADATLSAPSLPTVGGYEVECQIGRGGMGVVYRATDICLHRQVALKMILLGEHANSAQLRRFRAEAEAVARLQHPCIVQIYEIGEHQGLPYLALEYVSGGSLAEHYDGTPQPPRESAALIQSLCGAVHAAHQKEILHRDLKPGNILLTREGSPKVADFGLAKQMDALDSDTQTGDVLGTPSYMAPEQASGQTKSLSPAADVYALGAILYEALTGRPPFRASTHHDTIMQVLNEDPVPPRRLQSKIPRDLETICLKCLDKRPARRYPSADALREDLERFLSEQPIHGRPVNVFERAAKFVRRRPAIATLIGVSLLAVGAVLATGAVYNSRLRQERSNLATANESLELKQKALINAKVDAELQREIAEQALDESQRLLSLSFVAYGRACALAAKIANLDESLVVSNSRSRQISEQALVQFKLQYDLLLQAGDPAVRPALDAYWTGLKDDSRIDPKLKRLSLDLARACGEAWRNSTKDSPHLQVSIRKHLYDRACAAADQLAAAEALTDAGHSFDEFWELYWGEMAIVESPTVERAMVGFGEALKRRKASGEPPAPEFTDSLKEAAKALRLAGEAELTQRENETAARP